MTQAELERAWKDYTRGCGSLNPEHSITLDQFKERVAAFKAVIDPWVTGEGSKESSIRNFAKAVGVKTWQGRAMFAALFRVIDSIHPIT